jgi:DNA-directed RNA polymerase specialized sigma24 family protein
MSALPGRERERPGDRLTRWEQEHSSRLTRALRARGVNNEHDVDDIKQDVLLKAWRAQWDEKPPFQSSEQEFLWVQRVGIHAHIDRERKHQCEKKYLRILIKSGKVRSVSDPAAELEQIETTKAITAALETLEPSLKQVVVWRFVEELTVRVVTIIDSDLVKIIHRWPELSVPFRSPPMDGERNGTRPKVNEVAASHEACGRSVQLAPAPLVPCLNARC